MSQDDILSQFEVQNPPKDGISSITWTNHETNLLVTSWDKTVTLYAIDSNKSFTKQLLSYYHDASVLDACISDDDLLIFSAGCDNKLRKCDTKNGETSLVGKHKQPIKSVRYNNNNHIVITGSWDKSIKLWDPRTGDNKSISQHSLTGKVFALDTCLNSLIVGCSDRSVFIYDIRKMSDVLQKESSLKHQTRYICFHPDGNEYILTSIEGRVAVEYIDQSPSFQKKKYAFKCHRQNDKKSNLQTIYPVNTVSFHPIYKTFGTGGCDGIVNIWDGNNKKRICQLPPYSNSISDIDFSHNGQLLAISSSYTWEQGAKDHKKDQIWIRRVKDSDVKPKNKNRKS